MPQITPARFVFAALLLLSGCPKPSLIVPDQTIPHQLAAPSKATILVRAPNGQVERQEVEVPAGWWVASPEVADPQP